MEEINKMQTVPDLERFLTYSCTFCRHAVTHVHITDTVLPSDRALSTVFKLDLPEPKRRVLLELFVQTVLFCREQKFKNEQTSALLSVIKCVHQANIGKNIY